ncbi:hypothetical protein DPEC_G00108280 [Dallia pectoralis]|uniref:Uncharacterized protein n=1 Tax=Dallia pectoralis TaxID=75939 RepID=A0ACC2GSH2_DALPE|nr:hypothetical protein DPEC_G00108280 [Dallia pectoralis]
MENAVTCIDISTSPLQPWRFDARRLGAGQWHPGALLEHPSPNPPVKARTKMFPSISQGYMSFVKAEITKKKQENACECRDGECSDLHRYINFGSYFDEPLPPWRCDED